MRKAEKLRRPSAGPDEIGVQIEAVIALLRGRITQIGRRIAPIARA